MKRSVKGMVCGLLTFIMISSILCTSASAATYSSQYLNSYRATVLPDSNGCVVISAHVTGLGYMDELGVKTIFLYESEDGRNFHQVICYECTDYPFMMGSGITFNKDLFRYYGKIGCYYYASVYVYGGKDGVGDMRNYQTSVIRATA